MERDPEEDPTGEERGEISTHTLTWSVTFLMGQNGKRKKISTHTLTWSVTKVELLQVLTKQISTHTLTWSVTCSSTDDLASVIDFNSHAHVERDPVDC